jgi:uncharacterized protein YceK
MKPLNIIIATAMLILITGLLSGCALVSTKQEPAQKSESVANIELGRKVAKDVTMRLSADKKGSEVTVKIVLDNPNNKPVTSVQSWLSYSPEALKGVKINVVDSPFELTAPYDNTFDEVNGLVMLGRSSSQPIMTNTINVAEVVFELATNAVTMVDFYDYKTDLSGHVSVNIMLDGVPYNVLLAPESPALIIQ